MRTDTIRNEARNLRLAGYSYSIIAQKTGVPKSTLSDWLSDLPYTPNAEIVALMGKARAAASAKKTQIKQEETDAIKKVSHSDIGSFSKRDLFMFGLGLYRGEGAKTNDVVSITNSDPKVIRIAIAWFRSLGVKTEQFAPRIHLYPDSNIELCLQFWSYTTSIPTTQFLETKVDTRTNKSPKNIGKLPFGTLHLGVRSQGRKEFGVQFARKIQAWNDRILEQIEKAELV